MCIVHSTSMTSSTIVAAKMDMTVKLGITLPKSIIVKIDQRRGDSIIKMSEKKMIYDKKIAAAANDDNEQSEKVGWWINELDSLGIEKSASTSSNNKSELKDSQELEDLADEVRRTAMPLLRDEIEDKA